MSTDRLLSQDSILVLINMYFKMGTYLHSIDLLCELTMSNPCKHIIQADLFECQLTKCSVRASGVIVWEYEVSIL